jgi:hypothetical protein
MAWVKLDDQWYDNPKLLDMPLESIGVWVIGLTYASRHLTDGFVPYKALKRIIDAPEDHTEALEARGLWQVVEHGWQIHDYLDYQPSAAEVKDRRKKRAEAGRIGGRASAEVRSGARADYLDQAIGEASAQANRSTPSRPVPTPDNSSSSSVTRKQTDNQQATVDNSLESVIGMIATRRLRASTNVRNPDAYRRKIETELRTDPEIRERMAHLARAYPDLTQSQMVDCLEGNVTILKHMKRASDA